MEAKSNECDCVLSIIPIMAADGEESVEQYVRRNLGKEVFERLVEPFCSGVYAGDPSKLSMTAAFGKVPLLPPVLLLSCCCCFVPIPAGDELLPACIP